MQSVLDSRSIHAFFPHSDYSNVRKYQHFSSGARTVDGRQEAPALDQHDHMVTSESNLNEMNGDPPDGNNSNGVENKSNSTSDSTNQEEDEPIISQAQLRSQIKSYPFREHNQRMCDDRLAQLTLNHSTSLIEQRIIIETEQLEMLLNLRPTKQLGWWEVGR